MKLVAKFAAGVRLFYVIPFRSVPNFGIGSSVEELGMPRNEHFLPRNNENRSESIPRIFFVTKFRSQPYVREYTYAFGDLRFIGKS